MHDIRRCVQLIPEQFTAKAQEPLISTWMYKMVASMEAAIFSCQCDQMQDCEGGCETIYFERIIIFARYAEMFRPKSCLLYAT